MTASTSTRRSRSRTPRMVNVTARRYVPSASTEFDTELDNKYVTEKISLFSQQTALVMIDVWKVSDPVLLESMEKRLFPLLSLARHEGWLIIHAPSQGTLWPSIKVLPGEILVTGENGIRDRCDPYITNSTRNITKVIIAGYDTNKCCLDKPCGIVSLSAGLHANGGNDQSIEIVLARDATRPQSTFMHNDYYATIMSQNLLESAPFYSSTTPTKRYIRSVLVSDLAQGFGIPNTDPIMINSTKPMHYPVPTSNGTYPPFTPVPMTPLRDGSMALVVVSCSNDYMNDGFRGRVMENRARYLHPLLGAVRQYNSGSSNTVLPSTQHRHHQQQQQEQEQEQERSIIRIIHVPNGRVPDEACVPMDGEVVMNTTSAFDSYIAAESINTLIYIGYAANTDMLFGVAGMARYYSNHRYLGLKVPAYYWVQEATLGIETGISLAGGEWGKKIALEYRQPLVNTTTGNILNHGELMQTLREELFSEPSVICDSTSTTPPLVGAVSLVPRKEVEVLREIYQKCGGSQWKFNSSTDVVGGGKPWSIRNSSSDPCRDEWFGVGCDVDGQHIVKLFPNPRYSGNPLRNCELPESIGQLTYLEHLYTSNDATPSSLIGGIPNSLGTITALKCIYFSHNNLTKPFPASLRNLINLQVFLARHNKIPGPPPDFSKMTNLRNVWIDSNLLMGTLTSLSGLKKLTYLNAVGSSSTNTFTGDLPSNLCEITCLAYGNKFTCPLPTPGCCLLKCCGDENPVPPSHPPPYSMGECIPQ